VERIGIQSFEIPGSKPAPIARVFASLIASSKEEFGKGNDDEGIRKILKALQLITPYSP